MIRPPTIYILCQTRRECFQYLAANSRVNDMGDTLEPVWIGSPMMMNGRDILDCDKVVRLSSHYTNPSCIDIETAMAHSDRRTSAPAVKTWPVCINGVWNDALTWDVQASSEFPQDADDVPEHVPVSAKFIVTVVIDEDDVQCYMTAEVHYKDGALSIENAHKVEMK